MRRVEPVWCAALGTALVVAGCSGGGDTVAPATAPTTSTTSRTSTTIPSTTTTRTAAASILYSVGDTLTGQEFSAQLLERTQGSTVQLTTTAAGRTVTCVATVGSDGAYIILKPVKGIEELRVVGDVAYLQDRPGSARSWLELDLSATDKGVPSQAIADALNLSNEVGLGDCRGIDRYAAIDATGDVKVKAFTGKGWTLSAPTDPESQGPKNSASKRDYVPATWTVDVDGRPVSYRSAGSSRKVSYSKWDVYEIDAPPSSQVRR